MPQGCPQDITSPLGKLRHGGSNAPFPVGAGSPPDELTSAQLPSAPPPRDPHLKQGTVTSWGGRWAPGDVSFINGTMGMGRTHGQGVEKHVEERRPAAGNGHRQPLQPGHSLSSTARLWWAQGGRGLRGGRVNGEQDGGDGAGATPQRHLGSVAGRDEKTARKGATMGAEKPSRRLVGGGEHGEGWGRHGPAGILKVPGEGGDQGSPGGGTDPKFSGFVFK